VALYLVQWDDVKNKYKRGGSAPDFRAGRSNVGQGVTSLAVTFASALSDTDYAVTVSWQNTQDSGHQIQPLVITSFSTTGFTVNWASPTDTANYKLNWIVLKQG
jgi:hypothetical protein